MPRYYAEKIYKSSKKLCELFIGEESKKTVVASSALSRALANRAFLLREQSYSESREVNQSDGHNGYKNAYLQEVWTALSRNEKAQQSLSRFYKLSYF